MNDYGSFRARLLVRMFTSKPSPRMVAEALELNRRKYPQIRQDEIDRYRFWGDSWPGAPVREVTTSVSEVLDRDWENVDNLA